RLHLYSSASPPALPSFPTRRSSDLRVAGSTRLDARRSGIGDQARRAAASAQRRDEDHDTDQHNAAKLDHQAHAAAAEDRPKGSRSEEHTSELQSRFDLVCRLLLEKK